LIALVGSERIGALLRKEKDEASPPNCFLAARRIHLHSSFAKPGGFLFSKIFRPRAGLSIVKNRAREKLFSANKIERSAK
jgi:hypothetical protein